MKENIVEDTAEEVDSLPEIDEEYVKHREYATKKYSKIEQERVKDGIKSKADEFEEDESDAKGFFQKIKNFAISNKPKGTKISEQDMPAVTLNEESDSSAIPPGRGNARPIKDQPIEKRNFLELLKYPMDKPHMGFFLIFNQYQFSQDHEHYYNSPRKGSIEDAQNLDKAMSDLGFTVKIYDNLKTRDIMMKIKKYSSSTSNSRTNAFGMAYLSHGETGGKLATYDDYINLNDMIQPFKEAKDLIGKPKIFIIQACRGSEYMDGNDVRAVAYGDTQQQYSWPVDADIICAFPTTEGHASWRNPRVGTWFIFDLMQQIKEFGKKIEFHHLLLRVNAMTSLRESNTPSNDYSHKKKQVSQIQSQLTKQLWFGDFKSLK